MSAVRGITLPRVVGAKIVINASEAWPVVAAGLGSAVIVAGILLLVARKQRKSDSSGLGEQLAHDREMREKQQDIDAARFEKQLQHDREMREQQNDAESERLDRQLAQDRRMRDRQHMRQTIAPIIVGTLDWSDFISLHKAISTAVQATTLGRQAIAGLAEKVGEQSDRLRLGSRTLVILAGPEAPVALTLKEVANDGDALVHLARKWQEAGGLDDQIENELAALLREFGHAQARFIEAANEAVEWRPSDE